MWSGGTDGSLRVWDLKSGQLEKTTLAQAASKFSPDGRIAAYSGTVNVLGRDRLIRLWNTQDGSPAGNIQLLENDAYLTVSPAGHYCGSERVEREILYVALTEEGAQQTFTPDEFQQQFGWQNDPSQVRLSSSNEEK
jgi:WD40 repeat protein